MKLDYRTWGFFSREQAIKGFELYQHGNVKLDKAWDVGYIDLSGRVKDGRVYEATVMLHLGEKGIWRDCTCPERGSCEHVCALLFAFRGEEGFHDLAEQFRGGLSDHAPRRICSE